MRQAWLFLLVGSVLAVEQVALSARGKPLQCPECWDESCPELEGTVKRCPKRSAPTVPPCPPGKVRNQDTAGQCCWPKQVWSRLDKRCVGPPRCPAPFLAQGEDCGCPEGQEIGPGTQGYCCWAGQAWSTGRHQCVGAPSSCPAGRVVSGEECKREAPKPAEKPSCPAGMVPLAGSFRMGSPDGKGESDERPMHNVMLHPYCLDRTEVTVAQYRACVGRGECRPASERAELSGHSAEDKTFWRQFCNWAKKDGRDQHPINCVSWSDADTYCRSTGGRLPTEAEWEFAARGAGARLYPWGEAAPSARRLNACDRECVALGKKGAWSGMYAESDGNEGTAPVGQFPEGATLEGVQDLAGNVWEWTADWYGPYGSKDEIDPPGPSSGDRRVVRGGGWASNLPSNVRGASRHRYEPTERNMAVGFRCARAASPK